MAEKRGLGKGLGALIPTGRAADAPAPARTTTAAPAKASTPAPAPVVAEAELRPDVVGYAELPIDAIAPNPRQPREVFDEDALAELVTSIRTIGLLQPIVVRPTATGYELVAGERRLRASKEVGLTVIPALIRHTDDADLLRDALLENLHRANLNALEEAAAYSQMLADFGCTQEELAARIGRSRPQITNTIRLLKLPTDVQRRVAAGVLSAGHARALLSLDDPAAMEALATRIVAEGLSVRAVEEIVIVGDHTTGKKDAKPRARSTRNAASTEIVEEMTRRLADALDTRVRLDGFATPKKKGTVVIECADIEDLRRIVDQIG
jgi:ParB family chromosome partitioning protein